MTAAAGLLLGDLSLFSAELAGKGNSIPNEESCLPLGAVLVLACVIGHTLISRR